MDIRDDIYSASKEARQSEKKERKSLFIRGVEGFFYAIMGFFLGSLEMPFGTFPLGLALLGGANRKVPFIYAGLCLSAFLGEDGVVTTCAYSVVLLIRVITRLTIDRGEGMKGEEISLGEVLEELFREALPLRMTAAAVGGFALGIYRLVGGGFLYYDLFGAVISIAAAPIGAFLVYGIFSERERKAFAYISSALLAFAVVFAAKELSVYGINCGAFFAMFGILFTAVRYGLVKGIAASIITGIAFSPLYTPGFILSVIGFWALARVSCFLGAFSSAVVVISWAIYVDDISAVTSFLPAVIASVMLFSVADKLVRGKGEEISSNEAVKTREENRELELLNISDIKFKVSENRIRMMRDTFGELSAFFTEYGEKMKRPLAGDIKQICDRSFESCCGSCTNKELCWEENCGETMGFVSSVSARVHKEGRIDHEHIPEKLRQRCEHLDDIRDEINHNCMLHEKQLLLCDKTEIFAIDYGGISELLESAVSFDSEEYTIDGELSKKLCRGLGKDLSFLDSAVVWGRQKICIAVAARDEDGLQKNRTLIRERAEKLVGCVLEDKGIEEKDGRILLILERSRSYIVELAKKCVRSPEEEKFCGDSVSVFENGEDKFYALISDGMGSGREAALTSGIVSMFCTRMLTASSRCDTTLKLLNGFLRNKGGGSMHECSATLDLMELDLIGGKASFYKSGAAPTYVFREGSLFKLRSKTLPLGIIRELDAKKISFDVGDGDTIVMVSDGVTGGKEECPWLFDLLKKSVGNEDTERIAELICQRAERENSADDISVVIAKIKKK